ncbi:MAG: redoxin domain-containing protein [Clostridia bacterium]|nr:redoxin domain-containing protein [Clostridia bacterium]
MKKLSFIILLVLLLSGLAFSGCAKDSDKTERIPYTITLTGDSGMPLAGVVINVFEDEDLSKLVWASTTDTDGKITFTALEGTYYAALKESPLGYTAKDHYPVDSDSTDIILEAKLLPKESLDNTVFSLGSVFLDFEVTDCNGEKHTLSKLLETKKAVVLNFWFMNCGPCKTEFPYLEKAFCKYSEDIALVALNPVDGTEQSISEFAKSNGLTFPMAKADIAWEKAMKLTAYPTTVVIDRYGTVSMIHKGMVTEEGVFERIFEFFTSESYTQTTIRNIEDIPDNQH